MPTVKAHMSSDRTSQWIEDLGIRDAAPEAAAARY
jgi:hypothetical protein